MLTPIVKRAAAPLIEVIMAPPLSVKLALWLIYYPRFRVWCREHPCNAAQGSTYQDRNAFYEQLTLATPLAGAIDYLEFGVYEGNSLKWWSRYNQHPNSRFVGFDSFDGLPEDANAFWHRGQFSTGKKTPRIPDQRVTFEVGWFHDTLPKFLKVFDRRSRLFIHLDADLYSSTFFALSQIGPLLQRGDLLVFDEFHDSVHEFRAFRDFDQIFRLPIEPVLHQANYTRVALIVS